jgi:Protein of unknown function (DUF2846)
MKSIITVLFITFIAFSTAAFAQSTETQTPPLPSPTPIAAAGPVSDSVAVIFYRYKAFVGSGLEPGVFCDDVEIAKMDNGRWFKAMLSPGKHVLQSNDKQAGIELDLKSGEEYYVRIDLVPGFWKGHGRVTMVPKEQGSFEIKKLKLLGKDKVRDPKRVVIE